MMSSGRNFLGAAVALFALLLVLPPGVGAQSPWKTLNGSQPAVIARGGFSGLFPGSSDLSYFFANASSIPGVIQWCDLQLTKDSVGLCLPSADLQNCTNIAFITNEKPTNDTLDGSNISGYFSYNFKFKELSDLSVVQGIYSRTPKFDFLPIETFQTWGTSNFQSLWLNVQNDTFYKSQNLSILNFLNSSSNINIDYLSSPEVAFLRNAARIFETPKVKFIFRFLEEDRMEETTNQTYASLVKNLTFIKTFASGILVPKSYIWPVTSTLYLEEPTSIVKDAHNAGLEIYAADFANDARFAYNYSFNPITEYLSFIDNKYNFSVDGVLTDFPLSASAAIGCFSHIEDSKPTGMPLVLSYDGASGVYPGCTDLAYERAVQDGADFIDCPVQVTQDGVVICQNSIDLTQSTTVSTSRFATRRSTIPQIQSQPGIFTFNLTWENIQELKPQISTPYLSPYRLLRNPVDQNAGNFMKLSDFLKFGKEKSSTGVTITIENAAFLAGSIGFDIIDSVMKNLNDSGYNGNKLEVSKVMILSSDSSVLVKFKEQTMHDCLYRVDPQISSIDSSAIKAISSFAHAVAVKKQSIFPTTEAFIANETKVTETLKAANLSVYVYLLSNEFVSQAWDVFSDPTFEIHAFVGAGVNGIITDFPDSGSLYKKRNCSKSDVDYNLPDVLPGGLLGFMAPKALPPQAPTFGPLTASNVSEPPIPSVTMNNETESPSSVQPSPPSMQPQNLPSFLTLLVMLIIASLLIIQ